MARPPRKNSPEEKDAPTRRAFLKTSTALAAGLTVTGKARASAPPQHTLEPQQPSEEAASSSDLPDVVIENSELRLVLAGNGLSKSLIHKPTGQECLLPEVELPAFTVTQYRPYENELQLRYPAKKKTYAAKSVRRDGNSLIVDFELVDHQVTIDMDTRDEYIAFKVRSVVSGVKPTIRHRRPTPLDEMTFLQLPIRNRKNFGEWLNVVWDEEVAVNLLGTDPYPEIDSEPHKNYRVLKAGSAFEVKLEEVGAALIVTSSPNLLHRIDTLEKDFGLPRGVQSRRRKEYPYSYYWTSDITPENVDEHVAWARKGGFRTFVIYYTAFAKTPGHYPFKDEYPRGMQDLQAIVRKIKEGGMIPGLHHHYNKAFGMDPYITPVPDPRLNWVRTFTLADDLDEQSTTITVEENPRGSDLASFIKYLQIGDELVEYEDYTTERPYRFTGCVRGSYQTGADRHDKGTRCGLMGSRSGVIGVYDQKTTIQEEVAERLGKLYQEAGFEFAYFDGAEDVPPPYWFTVSYSQWLVYNAMQPRPLFSEGACKSHFSWHILTRGNAFDIYRPELIKAAIREHPSEEAPRLAQDFTGLNFGWLGYWRPEKDTIGTQPDMLEFASSRAAAWDCPISFRGILDNFAKHPRTPDNLEVLRRWEEVRVRDWLQDEHRRALRNLDQEHILLVNQQQEFELVPCTHLEKALNGDSRIRVFLFERNGDPWVVYWHTSGEGRIRFPLTSEFTLMEEIDGPGNIVQKEGDHSILAAAGRRYIQFRGHSRQGVIDAFDRARLI